MNYDVFYFVMFVIYSLAEKYKKNPKDIFLILEKNNVINEYLVKHFDVLHTLGKECLVNDISEYFEYRGKKLC